jgi:hypothetical protein
VYADITLATVALNTPNNVAVFVTDAPAKSVQVSYFPILSHGVLVNKITNAKTRELQSARVCKQTVEKYSALPLKFFQCSQHKFNSSELVTTGNHSVRANSRTIQFAIAQAKPSLFISPIGCLVRVPNSVLRFRCSTAPAHADSRVLEKQPSTGYDNSDSESELLYDWQFTVNQFVLAPSPFRLTTSIFFNSTEHLRS